MNGFVAMVFSFPFVCCRVGEDFLHEFLAFLGKLPSPAWPVVSADAVPVDAVDVSGSFEFYYAASQALRRVMVSEVFRYLRQSFLCDWFFDCVEDYYHVELRCVVH